MKNRLYTLVLIVIAASIYLLERNYMFGEDVVGEEAVTSTIYIGSLLLFSFLAVLLSWQQPCIKSKFSRRFTSLMIITYVMSLLFSLAHPFESRNTYFFIILPLLIFYSTSSLDLSKYGELFLWLMTVVAALLWLFYFLNYSNNILYDAERQYNGSYAVLYFLPFLLCHKSNVLRWVSIAMIVFIVMISLKRGGFIAVIVAVAVYFLVTFFSLPGRRFGIGHLLILLGAIFGLFYLVQYINGVVLNDLLLQRMIDIEAGAGSGRIDIYTKYLHFIQSDSILHLIFGHGWQGSIIDSGIDATCHNDFLEVFVDFGIIGFIAYIAFWISLLKLCVKMVRNRHEYAPAMSASVALFFVNSMVAHIIIYTWYLILFAAFWGYIVSNLNSTAPSNLIRV